MKPATWPREDALRERLLWIDPSADSFGDATVGDLAKFPRPGDLLVVNDAATLPASLTGEAMVDGTWEPIEIVSRATTEAPGGAWSSDEATGARRPSFVRRRAPSRQARCCALVASPAWWSSDGPRVRSRCASTRSETSGPLSTTSDAPSSIPMSTLLSTSSMSRRATRRGRGRWRCRPRGALSAGRFSSTSGSEGSASRASRTRPVFPRRETRSSTPPSRGRSRSTYQGRPSTRLRRRAYVGGGSSPLARAS